MKQTTKKPARIELKIERHPGISRLLKWDEKTNKHIEAKGLKNFRAIKFNKGKKKSQNFYTLKEAVAWKNSYSMQNIQNSSPKGPFIRELWERYKEAIFPSLEPSSAETKLYRSGLIRRLFDYRIDEISPCHIDDIIRGEKQHATKHNDKKRYNFDKEIDELKVLFRWYRENDDHTFACPILKRHYEIGKIRDIPERNKKMKPEELMAFLVSLQQHCDILYYDLAITQFYTASRIGEMAGLQKVSVDFTQEQIEIKHTVVWDRHRKFGYLKDKPKNGEVRYCKINDTMKESLLRQYNSSKCDYVFQKDGQPLTYRDIQYNYNKALKKCGLSPKYASTHIMRHSMASITRNVTGSADSTQAVTGHKDIRMVEHYAGAPDNRQKQAVLDVEKFLNTNVIPFKKNEGSLPQTPTEGVAKISNSI